MKNTSITLTISNAFTGYSKKITGRNGLPAVSTVRAAIRESKASDCKSETRITGERGERYAIHSRTGHASDAELIEV